MPADGSDTPTDLVADPGGLSRSGLLRAWGVLVGGDLVAKAVGVATVILISRTLEVGQFGTYSFAVAYGSSFTFLTDLGLDAATTRELADRPPADEGAVLGSALVVKSGLVLIAALAAGASLFGFPVRLRLAAGVAAVSLLASVPGTPALLLNARIRVVAATLVQLGGAVVTIGATIAVLRFRHSPTALVGVSSGVTIQAAVARAALSRRIAVARLSLDRAMMGAIVRSAAPIGLALIGVVVYRRADQLLLGAFHRISDLAQYAAAVRLVDALNILPLAVATLALPVLTRIRAADGSGAATPGPGVGRDERMAAVGYRLLAAVILPLASLATYEGAWMMGEIFGRPFRPAGAALAVLLWAHYFGFTGVLVDQVLISRRQSRYLATLTLVGAVINIGANLWAIPRFGKIGAAYTSLGAYAFPFAAGALVPAVRETFRSCLSNSIRPAVAALIVVVVLEAARPGPLVGLVIFATVLPPILLLTGSIRRQEVGDIVSAVMRPGRSTAMPRTG